MLFELYGLDKSRAVKGGRRISERTLHWLALLAGLPGGWAGRSVLGHKTRKGIFFFVLTLATAAACGAMALDLFPLIRSVYFWN